MSSKYSHSQNVLESGFATVTSGGHWFHATRETVEDFVPGLLDRHEYEDLILKAVSWINSTDSLSLLLYYILVFLMPAWIAAFITVVFYFTWYYKKSALVIISLTPVLDVLNHDALQLGVAAVILSILGITGNYYGLLYGFLFFFLFKVGLLRLFLSWMEAKSNPGEELPLNDRVFKMLLIRYSIYEDLSPPEVSRLEDHLKEAFLKFKRKK